MYAATLSRRVLPDTRCLICRVPGSAFRVARSDERWRRAVAVGHCERKRHFSSFFQFKKKPVGDTANHADEKETTPTQAAPSDEPHDTHQSRERQGQDDLSADEIHTRNDSAENQGSSVPSEESLETDPPTPEIRDTEEENRTPASSDFTGPTGLEDTTTVTSGETRSHAVDDAIANSTDPRELVEPHQPPAQSLSSELGLTFKPQVTEVRILEQLGTQSLQDPDDMAVFAGSNAVLDTCSDAETGQSDMAAPGTTAVPQGMQQQVSLILFVKGLWQLIRVISFTEALNTLRFGDPDTLFPPSVLAGYIQHLWRFNPERHNFFRYHEVLCYEYLLFYITLGHLDTRASASDPRPTTLWHARRSVMPMFRKFSIRNSKNFNSRAVWQTCQLVEDPLAWKTSQTAGALILLRWNRLGSPLSAFLSMKKAFPDAPASLTKVILHRANPRSRRHFLSISSTRTQALILRITDWVQNYWIPLENDAEARATGHFDRIGPRLMGWEKEVRRIMERQKDHTSDVSTARMEHSGESVEEGAKVVRGSKTVGSAASSPLLETSTLVTPAPGDKNGSKGVEVGAKVEHQSKEAGSTEDLFGLDTAATITPSARTEHEDGRVGDNAIGIGASNEAKSSELPLSLESAIADGNLVTNVLDNFSDDPTIRLKEAQQVQIQIIAKLKSLSTPPKGASSRRAWWSVASQLKENLLALKMYIRTIKRQLAETNACPANPAIDEFFDRYRYVELSFTQLQKFSEKLAADQCPIFWKRAVHAMERRVARDTRIGPRLLLQASTTRLSNTIQWLSKRKISASIAELLRPRRAPNRFTDQSYPSVAEEIEAVRTWRAGQLQTVSDLRDKYLSLDGEEDYDARMQLRTAELKYRVGGNILERLRQEASATRTAGPQVQQSQAPQGAPVDPTTMEGPQAVTVPYHILHYVFEDILHVVKTAMLNFGRANFRDIMVQKDWYSAESISVVQFVDVMKTEPHFKDRVVFCDEEFTSLRLIRNAYAHEDGDYTVSQTLALLEDAEMVIHVLGNTFLQERIQRYRGLIQEYEKTCMSREHQLQMKYSAFLTQIEAERRESERLLDEEEARLRGQLEQVAVDRSNLVKKYEAKAARRKAAWSHASRRAARFASGHLRHYVIDNQVRRQLNSMSPSRASELAAAIAKDYIVVKSSSPNLPKENTQQSGQSDAGPFEQRALEETGSPDGYANSQPVGQPDNGDSRFPWDAKIDENPLEPELVAPLDEGDVPEQSSTRFSLPDLSAETRHVAWEIEERDSGPSSTFPQDNDETSEDGPDDAELDINNGSPTGTDDEGYDLIQSAGEASKPRDVADTIADADGETMENMSDDTMENKSDETLENTSDDSGGPDVQGDDSSRSARVTWTPRSAAQTESEAPLDEIPPTDSSREADSTHNAPDPIANTLISDYFKMRNTGAGRRQLRHHNVVPVPERSQGIRDSMKSHPWTMWPRLRNDPVEEPEAKVPNPDDHQRPEILENRLRDFLSGKSNDRIRRGWSSRDVLDKPYRGGVQRPTRPQEPSRVFTFAPRRMRALEGTRHVRLKFGRRTDALKSGDHAMRGDKQKRWSQTGAKLLDGDDGRLPWTQTGRK